MSKPAAPPSASRPTLTDPRSTGTGPRPRLPDVLGLRGTKRS